MAPDEKFSIAVAEKEGRPLLTLEGTVDILAVQDLMQAARGLSERGEDTLVCCEKVRHLDCAALQLLLALKKALGLKGKKIEILAKSTKVERLFEWAALN
jgi:anti-anti-sigma factor